MVAYSFWCEDRDGRLRAMLDAGASASMIASALGTTKNAVLGRKFRLGLGKPMLPRTPEEIAAARQRRLEARRALNKKHREERRVRPRLSYSLPPSPKPAAQWVDPPEPTVVENIVPVGQRCSILELNESTCRWPIGDPSAADFFFCGGKTTEGLPYCGYHSRIAYVAPQWRRRAA